MLTSCAAHATQLVAIIYEIAGDGLLQKAGQLARLCPPAALAISCGMTASAVLIGGIVGARAFSPAVEP